jgi:hypothetical protein
MFDEALSARGSRLICSAQCNRHACHGRAHACASYRKQTKKFISPGHIVFWGCLLRIKHILYLGSVTCECHVTSLSRTYFHALLAVLWIGIRSDPEIFWPGWILIRENHSRSEIETDLFDIQIFLFFYYLYGTQFSVVKFFFDYVHTYR